MTITAYSAKNVIATIDGLPVQGLFDGDNAIQVSQGSDIGTGIIGMQGDGIFSQSADKSATLTLRLLHTSGTHQLLHQKVKAQQAGILGSGFRVSVMDTGSGEGGTGEGVFVQKQPDDMKGKSATVREWVLWIGNYDSAIPGVVE